MPGKLSHAMGRRGSFIYAFLEVSDFDTTVAVIGQTVDSVIARDDCLFFRHLWQRHAGHAP
ncbi:hypothetical protein [Rhodopseudomonas boonkerdii]|uniref:hypothetical protein n=1 Tax=Rhodopseudomonas boonkerdii TaxID=475937 RepID=UPI001E3D530C|nr:hypothetical protein [Rhodopseudomonas boonkerdii]